MKSKCQDQNWSRRGFLRGAGLLGMGGAVAALADGKLGAANPTAKDRTAAPTGYDITRFGKVDPQLIKYELVSTISTPSHAIKRVVIGSGGQVFTVGDKQMAAFNHEGRHVLEINATEEVRCLAVASDGFIYAGLRNTIVVYDKAGKEVNSWRPEVNKPWFTSLAVGEDDLFAADAANRVVLRFDRTGKLMGRIGEKNKERGIAGFIVPSPYFDLEIGQEGLLWVANPGHHRLEAYTFDGDLESSWGVASFGISGFCGCCNPSYFTRLVDGRFVTSEKGLPRLKVYSARGEFESVVAGAESFPKYFENVNAMPVALDVAADAEGRILVADALAGEVRVYGRKGEM